MPASTPARSWAELAETTQGGLAVLDVDLRVAFANERFLPTLGDPDDFVGCAIERLLPALAAKDPRKLRRSLDAGERVAFEEQLVSVDGDNHWYEITVVPSTELDRGLAAVVFSRDTTATTRRFVQMRNNTTDLTRVENERRSRVSRDVHDGPVQLLAALIFRLGMSETNEARELQQTVSNVSSTLRAVIEEFSPPTERRVGSRLEQWIAPLLVDTEIDLRIQDERSEASGLAESQAIFVILYEVVRGIRDTSRQRTFTVRLTDEEGGQRILFAMPSMQPNSLTGKRALRFRAIANHVQSLGGTLMHSLDEHDVRSFSMWIPKLTHPTPSARRNPRLTQHPRSRQRNDVTSLPPLSNAGWLEIVSHAPERMVEIDHKTQLSWANAALAEGVGRPPDELVGMSGQNMGTWGDIDDTDEVFGRLHAGEFVETHWHRTDKPGERRLVRLALSPRFSLDGAWEGFFVTTNDRSDVGLLDELYQTSLADLSLARHLAIEASIDRLAKPLDACEQLIERINEFEQISSDPDAIRNIKTAFVTSLRSVKSSSIAFTDPPRSINDLAQALRESLGTLLDERQLRVIDHTEVPPSTVVLEAVFRIAREAVSNAVLHGVAETVTISLSATEGGVSCIIHDDGLGVSADQLDSRPGHLGIRSMQARAQERDGTCRIQAGAEVGTVVTIWLPDDPLQPSHSDGLAPTS